MNDIDFGRMETMLIGLGIPPYSNGGKYFAAAAEIVLSSGGKTLRPFKDIYPLIARKYNVSVDNVYSSMKYALKRASSEHGNSSIHIKHSELIRLLCT